MSNPLRFTPDDYLALRLACRPLTLTGSYIAFQRCLVEALQSQHPLLARRIESLPQRQVRTLRVFLTGQQEQSNRPTRPDDPSRCDLSFQEWLAVRQACALICLQDDCPHSFRGRLLGEVAEVEPALAAKLRRLDEGQVATLYRRVKAGKRWCP